MKKSILKILVIIGITISTLAPINSIQAMGADHSEFEKARDDAQQALQELKNAQTNERQLVLRNYGEKAIQQRIRSLEQIRNQINNMQMISAEDKVEITNNLTNAENGLNTLLGQIKGEEDITQLHEHVQNIFYNYRIYVVELPKDYGLKACGVLDYLIETKIEKVYEKLDEIVTKLQEAGKDTATLEVLIADFKSYVAAAKSDLEAAKTEFRAAVAAQNLTEAQTHLQAGRKHVQSARTNMQMARVALQQIRAEIENLVSEERGE